MSRRWRRTAMEVVVVASLVAGWTGLVLGLEHKSDVPPTPTVEASSHRVECTADELVRFNDVTHTLECITKYEVLP